MTFLRLILAKTIVLRSVWKHARQIGSTSTSTIHFNPSPHKLWNELLMTSLRLLYLVKWPSEYNFTLFYNRLRYLLIFRASFTECHTAAIVMTDLLIISSSNNFFVSLTVLKLLDCQWVSISMSQSNYHVLHVLRSVPLCTFHAAVSGLTVTSNMFLYGPTSYLPSICTINHLYESRNCELQCSICAA